MTEFVEDPKVEEIDSDDEEDQPQVQVAKETETPSSRAEKKTRKAMQKMGMKPVPGISRVAMKKSKDIVLAISNPDVYKSQTSNTYIVVGDCKVEDVSGNAGAARAAAEQYSKVQPAAAAGGAPAGVAAKPGAEEDTDETGVEAKDIDLVMGQANCTRGQAVAALKKNENDIVNAIMELTM
jgi:nascent polypeptide-associated complex subunit alpha